MKAINQSQVVRCYVVMIDFDLVARASTRKEMTLKSHEMENLKGNDQKKEIRIFARKSK